MVDGLHGNGALGTLSHCGDGSGGHGAGDGVGGPMGGKAAGGGERFLLLPAPPRRRRPCDCIELCDCRPCAGTQADSAAAAVASAVVPSAPARHCVYPSEVANTAFAPSKGSSALQKLISSPCMCVFVTEVQ